MDNLTKRGKHCGKRRNCFFCHYVFKKPSAAEASESVYMRERVKRGWENADRRINACYENGVKIQHLNNFCL